MTQVLCLANSRKEHHRCVAGIELETGKLVRPVSKTHSQAIPEQWTELDGRPIKPLDVVDIPFVHGNAAIEYQSENRFCLRGWRRIGKAQPADLIGYCEPDGRILHTSGDDAILERFFRLSRLGRNHWKSLQLVRAQNVEFYERRKRKWNARFRNCAGREYDLRVTDDRFSEPSMPQRHDRANNDAFLLLSLSPPWKHHRAPRSELKKCYKLVAGVVFQQPSG